MVGQHFSGGRRKPHNRQSIYEINISPTETRRIAIRGRRKPRKARLEVMRRLNELIKEGAISAPEFDAHGRLLPGGNAYRTLTEEECEIITTACSILCEPISRRPRPGLESSFEAVRKKWHHFMQPHAARGQFFFLSPVIEETILEGGDPHAIVSLAEMRDSKRYPGLRATIERFKTRKKSRKTLGFNWDILSNC